MMKYILLVIFVVVHLNVFAQKLQVGDTAPEIALPDPEGDTARLSEVNKGRLYIA